MARDDLPSPPEVLDAGLRFGFLIHDVSRLRRIVIDRALRPLGITRSQWLVLAYLSRREGMTQTELATELDLTKVAVGGLLDRMETAGFVARKVDPSDGRARIVCLTKAGAQLVGQIRAQVERTEIAIHSGVGSRELAQAADTLHALKATLLEMAEGGEADDMGAAA